MASDPRAQLRALALWHTRRRLVDELLAPLLEYGPAAVDRVGERLAEIRALVQAEQQAFAAFDELMREHPASQAVVLELFPQPGPPDGGDISGH